MSEHLTQQALIERGWTLAMIRDLLGEPDDYADNPHYRSATPCKLYALRRIKQKERTKKFAELKARAEERKEAHARGKDYGPLFERRYGTRDGAIGDAAEKLWNLNRYAKHSRCSRSHRAEIYDLKNRYLAWLQSYGYLTGAGKHQIVKPSQGCWGCDGWGCERCDDTGVWREELTLDFVMLRYEITGRTYTWHQPAETVKFDVSGAPEIPTSDEWSPDREKPIAVPARKFSEAKALIRWVLEARGRASGRGASADRPRAAPKHQGSADAASTKKNERGNR